MERAADGRFLVVCDACVLINFLLVGRFDLLSQNPDFRCLVTEHVVAEITKPSQAAALAQEIEVGHIELTEVNDLAELALFAELTYFLGAGEAAAIAVAYHRDLAVATDDGRTCREIEQRLGPGRLLTTPGILLRAIRNDALKVKQADEIKRKLEKHRFKMTFGSFGDLL